MQDLEFLLLQSRFFECPQEGTVENLRHFIELHNEPAWCYPCLSHH